MLNNNKIHEIIREEISRADEKKIRNIISDTLEEFFRTMWQRKSFWQSGMKK
jgi:hypothetical protein